MQVGPSSHKNRIAWFLLLRQRTQFLHKSIAPKVTVHHLPASEAVHDYQLPQTSINAPVNRSHPGPTVAFTKGVTSEGSASYRGRPTFDYALPRSASSLSAHRSAVTELHRPLAGYFPAKRAASTVASSVDTRQSSAAGAIFEQMHVPKSLQKAAPYEPMRQKSATTVNLAPSPASRRSTPKHYAPSEQKNESLIKVPSATSAETLSANDETSTKMAGEPPEPRAASETEIASKSTSTDRPIAATLHLDGATLGRWAVQHLERILSKQVNGITGIDPRASVPRGRVSPF